MFSMTKSQITEMSYFAYTADKEARSDLAGGFIRDEDDYTSNFTGALRRIINSNSRFGLTATSFLLGTAIERALGCDGTIIIQSNGEVKIIMFEAKLPRISDPRHRWDYAQTSTGLSHFSDQLARQNKFRSNFVIFEMFYCDILFLKQPAYMKDEVSSCVWLSDATAFDATRSATCPPWTHGELVAMLKAGNHDIGTILKSVCKCEVGTPIPMPDDPMLVAGEFGLSGHILYVKVTSN